MKRFGWCMMILMMWGGWGAEAGGLREALQASRTALEAGDLESAVAAGSRAVRADAGSVAAWKQYGRALQLAERHTEALEAFDMAAALVPEDEERMAWQVASWVATRHGPELEETLAGVAAAVWADFPHERIAAVAWRLREDGRPADAVLWAEAALAEKPGAAGLAAGLRLLAGGNRLEAEKLLDADRLPADYHLLAAKVLAEDSLARGDSEAAMHDLVRMQALDPEHRFVRREMGWLFYRMGRMEDAIQSWSVPGRPDAWSLWVARARYALGDTDAVMADLERFLSAQADHPEALAMKATLLLADVGEADMVAWASQIESDPLRTQVMSVARMRVARDAGRFEDAMAEVHEWIQEDRVPAFLSLEFEDLLAKWAAVTPASRRVAVLRDAVALRPERGDWRRDLGWALWTAGHPEEGVAEIEAALELGLASGDSVIYQVVAGLVESGRVNDAMAFYKRQGGSTDGVAELALDMVRANRINAARPLLEIAWEAGHRDPVTALYLAYALATVNRFERIPDLLRVFLDVPVDEMAEGDVDLVYETLRLSERVPEVVALTETHPFLAEAPPVFAERVTDLMESHALYLLAARKPQEALPHLLRVLERAPARPIWSRAVETARNLDERGVALRLMAEAPIDELPEWEVARLEGLQAEAVGEPGRAADAFAASWRAKSEQTELVGRIFHLLAGVGRMEEAAGWLARARMDVDSGAVDRAAEVAEMLDVLGRSREAAYYWELARMQAPGMAAYTLSAARSLMGACDVAGALVLLGEGLAVRPDPNASLLAAEGELMLGRPAAAAVWVDDALRVDALHPGLLRFRAELAEVLEEREFAVEMSERWLLQAPRSEPARRLYGRTLVQAGAFSEAIAHYEGLLAEGVLVPEARARLRELYTLTGSAGEALKHAEAMVRAWDHPENRRLLGATRAEVRDFPGAVSVLRPLARQPVHAAVPVLLFDQVRVCEFAGALSPGKVAALLEVLAAEDRRVVSIADAVGEPADTPRVVLVFSRVEVRAMPALRVLLDEMGLAAAHFDLPTVDADTGFVVAGDVPFDVPARRVPASWGPEELTAHLREANPYVRARLTLAKVYAWQDLTLRAEHWFSEAAQAGAAPYDTAFSRGMNAWRGGNLTLAEREIALAASLRPDDQGWPEVQEALRQERGVSAEGNWGTWSDSDDRRFTNVQAVIGRYVHKQIRLLGMAEGFRVSRKGQGEEDGWGVGLGLEWRGQNNHEIEAQLRGIHVMGGKDHAGGALGYRLPVFSGSGALGITATRELEETVEAVRADVLRDRVQLSLQGRMRQRWDGRLQADGIFRTDGNTTGQLEGLLIYRLHEVPFVGAGLRVRLADTDVPSDLYYTPESLEQYQGHLTLRGRLHDRLRLRLSGDAGVARDRQTDWMFVWNARGELIWSAMDHLQIHLGATHLENARYEMDTFFLQVSFP